MVIIISPKTTCEILKPIMDYIFGCERKAEDDFYRLLGCDESSTPEQIMAEYKVRVLAVHPDKNPENKQAEEVFKKLLNAKLVLLDAEKRKTYDTWRSSGIVMPFEQWQALGKNSQMCFHWSIPKNNDLMLESGSTSIEGDMKSSLEPKLADACSEVSSKGPSASSKASNKSSSVREFRCNSGAPSEALRKFRAYEI